MIYLDTVHKTELNFRQTLEIKSSSSSLNILVSSYFKNNLVWVHPENQNLAHVSGSRSCQASKPNWISIYASRGKTPETVESVSLMRPRLEHKSYSVIGAWKSVHFNISVKFVWSFWPLRLVMYPELLHSFKRFVSLELIPGTGSSATDFFFFSFAPLMMWNTACTWIICYLPTTGMWRVMVPILFSILEFPVPWYLHSGYKINWFVGFEMLYFVVLKILATYIKHPQLSVQQWGVCRQEQNG